MCDLFARCGASAGPRASRKPPEKPANKALWPAESRFYFHRGGRGEAFQLALILKHFLYLLCHSLKKQTNKKRVLWPWCSQTPAWLEQMIAHTTWRDLFYKLAEAHPDCLMLNFTVKVSLCHRWCSLCTRVTWQHGGKLIEMIGFIAQTSTSQVF